MSLALVHPIEHDERGNEASGSEELAAPAPPALARAEGPLGAALAWHLAEPGGGMRRALAGSAARALALDGETGAALADIVEAVHEASILLDDVADREETRRGRAACAVRHGPDLATLAAITLLARAQSGAAALAPRETQPGALQAALAQAIAQACEGQARDLAEEPLTWAHYDLIARAKTGRIVALAVELPAILAGLGDAQVAAAREAATLIGLAYQIRDDIADGDLAPDGLEPSPSQRLEALRAEVVQAIARAPAPLAPVLARLARSVGT